MHFLDRSEETARLDRLRANPEGGLTKKAPALGRGFDGPEVTRALFVPEVEGEIEGMGIVVEEASGAFYPTPT